MSNIKIIIQKFGGTSVSSKELRQKIVNKVQLALNNGYSPVLVVSAMGRKGDPYATDSLLQLIDDNYKEKDLYSRDLLMSCGEIISSVVLCNELFNNNIHAVPLTGGQAGIITNNSFTKAEIIKLNLNKITSILTEGNIPVVAGFQGITEDGFFSTLGRGGSDITAVVLGKALNACAIEIYTDVDGIMTADPKLVSNASLIKEINYDEVLQLAREGAKVIHQRAVEEIKESLIPLKIKNTNNQSNGTLIIKNNNYKETSILTAITHLCGRIQIILKLKDNINNFNYKNTLNILADKNISIDLINISTEKIVFTIDEEDFNNASLLLNEKNLIFSYRGELCKISLIGNRIHGIPGVMARILTTLCKININILQTSDSNLTIWCLIYKNDLVKALNALHEEFNL